MLSDHYLRIPLEQIYVERDARQRKAINVEDLLPSIRDRGVLQPVIVARETNGSQSYRLIAGERRFTASKELGLADIPARLANDLSHNERQIIELEENVKRQDLDWKDQTFAIRRIHNLYKSENPDWTQTKTADAIGMTQMVISMCLEVASELDKGNPQIIAAQGVRAAYNVIQRKTSRAVDDVMNEMFAPTEETHVAPSVSDSSAVSNSPVVSSNLGNGNSNLRNTRAVEQPPISNSSFIEFAKSYSGAPFNFLHCDFPYGINLDKSDQGNSAQWGGYADSPDVYWELCGALASNLNRIMAPSAHMMFWFSMEFYRETLDFFAREAPSLEFQKFPLMWHKTDNKGILPDPNRGPRRIYETAFIASRGDRKIVKSVSNTYGCPTSKEIHQSEKPEPMLKHFFQMFIDENSRVLDPTCGSGTALRAADSMGAAHIQGFEINPDTAEAASIALRKSRTLRNLG